MRDFTPERAAQGFRDQAHLDAWYRYYDHTLGCDECKARNGHVLLDDGWQPTMGRCPVARELQATAR